ncbi:protease B nonderepressible form, partial [Spiromyces aspiralis]
MMRIVNPATICLTAAVAMSMVPLCGALSRSGRSPPSDTRGMGTVYAHEEHIFISPHTPTNINATRVIDAHKDSSPAWRVMVDEGWHSWVGTDLYEGNVLPLWPTFLESASLVITSGRARGLSRSESPEQGAVLASPDLEWDGIHIQATTRQVVVCQQQQWPRSGRSGVQLTPDVRALIGEFLFALGGPGIVRSWDRREGHPIGAFISVGDRGLYYYTDLPKITKHQISDHVASGKPKHFDLVRAALPHGHFLIEYMSPNVVTQENAKVLDQVRAEATLTRTHNGFIEIKATVVSRIHSAGTSGYGPSSNAPRSLKVASAFHHHHHHQPATMGVTALYRLAHSTESGVMWQGRHASNQRGFSVAPASLAKIGPSSSEAATTTVPNHHHHAGSFSAHFVDSTSFHPKLSVAVHHRGRSSRPTSPLLHGCQLKTLVPLPQTHFFDPYQIHDLYASLGPADHYGPIELELPTENINAWGSVLSLSAMSPTRPGEDEDDGERGDSLSATIPLHKRYRLTSVIEQYRFERSPKLHTSPGAHYNEYTISEVIEPPLVFWRCLGTEGLYKSKGFMLGRPVPALLAVIRPDYFGLIRKGDPVVILPLEYQPGQGSPLLLKTPLPDPELSDPISWVTTMIVAV